jgi:hypothetical protein
MDPQACLDRVERLLDAGELDDGRDALDDYREWRLGGGFEPDDGDKRARLLARRWADALFAKRSAEPDDVAMLHYAHGGA